jgi:hypothetical protein
MEILKRIVEMEYTASRFGVETEKICRKARFRVNQLENFVEIREEIALKVAEILVLRLANFPT